MTVSEDITSILKEEGTRFIVSVPCKLLDELIRLVDADPEFTHVPVTREEEGIGICAGAFLGGELPVIMMQNSGLGNSINAIASLISLYNIPLIMIMSHRGTAGEKIKAQIPMGNVVPKLLEDIEVEYKMIHHGNDVEEMRGIIRKAKEGSKPVAILLPFSFWGVGSK